MGRNLNGEELALQRFGGISLTTEISDIQSHLDGEEKIDLK